MLGNDIMMRPYAEGGYIRRVLLAWNGPEFEMNALFPRGRVQSPKVRAFVDFLVERLNFDAGYMQSMCPGTSCSEVGKGLGRSESVIRAPKRRVTDRGIVADETAEIGDIAEVA